MVIQKENNLNEKGAIEISKRGWVEEDTLHKEGFPRRRLEMEKACAYIREW